MKIGLKIFVLLWLLSVNAHASILRVGENNYLKVNAKATVTCVDTKEKATNCFTVFHVYNLGITGNTALRVIFIPSTIIPGLDLDSLFYLGYHSKEGFFLMKNTSFDRVIPEDILWRFSSNEGTHCLVHNIYRKMVLAVESPVFR